MTHHKYDDEDQTCCGYADVDPTEALSCEDIRKVLADHGLGEPDYWDFFREYPLPTWTDLNNWLGY